MQFSSNKNWKRTEIERNRLGLKQGYRVERHAFSGAVVQKKKTTTRRRTELS